MVPCPNFYIIYGIIYLYIVILFMEESSKVGGGREALQSSYVEDKPQKREK